MIRLENSDRQEIMMNIERDGNTYTLKKEIEIYVNDVKMIIPIGYTFTETFSKPDSYTFIPAFLILDYLKNEAGDFVDNISIGGFYE